MGSPVPGSALVPPSPNFPSTSAVLKLEALQNLWEGLLPHRFLGLTPEILVQSGG